MTFQPRTQIAFNRERAAPSAWTFKIKPIKAVLEKYVKDGKGWVDPFAGNNSPAQFTNDMNPDRKAKHHMEAFAFAEWLPRRDYAGVLFDPPYSYRQVSEHYKMVGRKATQEDTSTRFYNRVMNPIADKIRVGGFAISFGWNTNGFGPNRGFELVEVLIVAHGGHHNDTLVTIERKVVGQPRLLS